ncbi:hypothetical protein G6F42_016261 [Rhizopus arrhizus]|nr:hypothetical protein G6F42_016261 [Rhizopus arrhizus]
MSQEEDTPPELDPFVIHQHALAQYTIDFVNMRKWRFKPWATTRQLLHSFTMLMTRVKTTRVMLQEDAFNVCHHPLLGPFDSQGISSSHTDQSTDYATNTLCARSVEWLEFNEFDTY